MNRIAFIIAAVLGVSVAFGMLPNRATAQTAPGTITFLGASCPSSSSMYQRVTAGQDPNSNENGSPAAPSDISAYGCTPAGRLGFFLLGGSTAKSVFLDSALTTPVTVSSSASGNTGGTVITSGTAVYVPGGVAQVRRFSVSSYPTTVTTRAAMPFLDLQCLTDGGNNDNADGAGWNAQAIAPGAAAYCIAYIWDGVTATASPTATPTASVTPTLTASPTPDATKPPSKDVKVTKTFVKANDTTVVWKIEPSEPADLLVWDVQAETCEAFGGAACGGLVDDDYGKFYANEGEGQYFLVTQSYKKKGESCRVKNTLEWATPDSKKRSSTEAVYVCPKPPSKDVKVTKTFVKANDTTVVWKIEPSEPADLLVWDLKAESCEAFGGAACGSVVDDDYGKFYASEGKGQYFLVTQSYKKKGESCSVKNTVEWATPDSKQRSSTDASYVCSGAPTMGWPLFGLFAAGALAMTWVARRKMQ